MYCLVSHFSGIHTRWWETRRSHGSRLEAATFSKVILLRGLQGQPEVNLPQGFPKELSADTISAWADYESLRKRADPSKGFAKGVMPGSCSAGAKREWSLVFFFWKWKHNPRNTTYHSVTLHNTTMMQLLINLNYFTQINTKTHWCTATWSIYIIYIYISMIVWYVYTETHKHRDT